MVAGPDKQQLDRVTTLVREVLGPDVVGAYLFGSAVLGGLQRESDLDVLVVSKRQTTREEKQRLVDRLLAISGRRTPDGRRRRVELTIVVESRDQALALPAELRLPVRGLAARRVRKRQRRAVADDDESRSRRADHHGAARRHAGARPAAGRDPRSRSPRRPLRAIVDGIDALSTISTSDTRNVILTLARIWSTVATGVIRSKDAAADWALARLPEEHRAVLARARAIYLGDEEEHWDDIEPLVRPHTDHVVGEINQLVSGSP